MIRILIALILFPLPALAFGPVSHLDMGLNLVASAALFGSGVRKLLRRHSDAFLRGTLDPDRSLAKNLLPYRRHSHNWIHAFRQYEAARIEAERAAFLGYLCHLAADTVAHNVFVPRRIVASARHPVAGHLYWESRLDARLRGEAGEAVDRLRMEEPREHRRLLHRTIRNSLPGRRLQVHLTGIAMRFQGGDGFGRVSTMIDQRSRLSLEPAEVQEVRELALAAQRQVLWSLREAPITMLDPRGIAALAAARAIKRFPGRSRDEEGLGDLQAVLRESESRVRLALGGMAAGSGSRPEGPVGKRWAFAP